jgi:two-component system NarL family sensor kinase
MLLLKPHTIFTLIIALFFLHENILSQTIPDSLTNKLEHAANDSVKTRTLLDIGEAIEEEVPEKSLNYYQQALVLSNKINNKPLILSSMVDVGIAYIETNDMDEALSTFLQAFPVAKQINDTGKIAGVLANIGNVYLHKSNPVKAIQYYLQSVTLLEAISDQTRLAVLYSNLCSLFEDEKQFDKSIEYGNKAFAIGTKNNDDHTVVYALINLSGTYSDLNQFEKEFELLQKALPLAKKIEDIEQLATVYNNLGDYYYRKKKYQPSLENYLESYKYVQQLGNHFHLCTACTHLATLYNEMNQPDKALQFILQAETLAKEVGYRADLKEIYLTRAETEQRRGNYKTAYNYRSMSADLSDSLFKAEDSKQIADIEAKYQNEKKQKEIIHLQKDKQIQLLSIKQKSTLNYFLFGSIAVLFTVGFLIYRNLRHRQLLSKQQDELQQQRINELEKDKQLVAVDSMLKGQEDERLRLAKDLHDGLGGMLSGVKFSLMNMKSNLIINHENVVVFERSLDMLDSSIKELRRVAHNMMPEALVKFGLDEAVKDYCANLNNAHILSVQYQSFGMAQRIDGSTEIIIYRIIQELLNNIFKHAKASEVLVQLQREENRLSITVEDNGKGFNINELEKSKGSGWANIRSRVDYLKGKLDLHSDDAKGTSVNIEINV